MADYPAAIPTLGPVPSTPATTPLGTSSPNHAVQHQELIDEVVAIATELGTDPAGSQFTTVKDMLAFLARAHTIQTIATAGTAQTFDLSSGATKIVTLTSATCTLSNPINPVTGSPQVVNFLEVIFKQDGTGGRTIAFSGWTIRWPGGGGPPALTSTATTGRDRFLFTSFDGGSTWDADYALALA